MRTDLPEWTHHHKSTWDFSLAREALHLIQSLSTRFTPYWPGVLLCIAVGLGGKLVGTALPILGSGTSAILLGIIVGNVLNLKNTYRPGIRLCESKVLEFAVACMGFSLSLQLLSQLGWKAGLGVMTAVVTALSMALLLSRFVKMPRATILLIGVGTAICGSSAIAAAAPLIAKDRKDIGISVGVISLLGIVGILILPVWTNVLGLDLQSTGLVVGGTLQSVAHVVAAGFSVNDDVGNLAVTIKMGRVAMLIPLVLYLTMSQKEPNPSQKQINVPWYLIAFLLAATVVSTGLLPETTVAQILSFDKLLLTVAMAAIGLSIHFKSLREQASKAILYGAIMWVVQIAAVSLVASL